MMSDIVGIKFRRCGKVYDFELSNGGAEYKKNDPVIVESDFGLSIGTVAIEPRTLENPSKELKKVIRKATEEDFKQKKDNEVFEEEAKKYCLERIEARSLEMRLVATETTLDKKKIIFYFTAEGRIDFREIVKDLAAKFKTRIEMRQIGVRDEAKIVGGFGLCGRELCCKTFLASFEPISIKMAKRQELVLNMNKLSGICGRLMCCLSYEYLDETGSKKTEGASVADGEAVLMETKAQQPQSDNTAQSAENHGEIQAEQKPAEDKKHFWRRFHRNRK